MSKMLKRVGGKPPINDKIIDLIAERMLEVMDGLVYVAIKLMQIKKNCKHLNYTYQPSEPENNVPENLTCDDCGDNLAMDGEYV